jgi:hypothetical protein
MAYVYHIVVIRVNETYWAHVWRLRFRYLRMGYHIITMSVRGEERSKDACGDFINHVKHNKKKNFSNSSQSKRCYSHDHKASSSKGQGKASMKKQDHVPKGLCRHCKQEGHYMRDCVEFLKWMNIHGKNKCKDLITSIDESLYLDYSSCTWWIDSGATIHVINSL